MLKKILIASLASSISVSALAESYIYLTNNTEQTLDLTITQRGSSLVKGEHWWQHANTVPPLGTVRFLEMNRDTGITWGSDFYFDTLVTAEDGSTATLQQKLTGTWNFSDIWHGTEQSPWYDDRNIHSVNQSFTDNNTTIAFKAEGARANGDDYYYVIHPEQEYPAPEASNNFKVMAYNVWALLPGLISKDVSERLNLLVNEVRGYDAIVFSELFDNSRRETFLNALKSEYPYQTSVVDKSGSVEDGGVLIVSRWPINASSQVVFDACDAEDCISAKGVIYAEVNKDGNPYHVFGSHTQAWTSIDNQNTRLNQFQQMRDFIDSRNISTDEPVIIAGDLNVDKEDYPQEYNTMLDVLSAVEVPRNGGYLYTADGSVNSWNDGSPEILDYVLYSDRHLLPLDAKSKVVTPRSIHSDVFTKYDLSDHFPITADMTFDTPVSIPEDESSVGNSWSELAGMRQVSIAEDGSMWATSGSFSIHRWNGNAWDTIPGGLKHVSVGSAGEVWGVNTSDMIYRYNGNGWTRMPGALKNVSVGSDGSVWGVNANDSIYRWNGSGWTMISGKLKQISVGSAENVWGVSSNNHAYRWNGNGWAQMSNWISNVAVASDGTVWATSPENAVYNFTDEDSWVRVNGVNLSQISAGSNTQVVGSANSGGYRSYRRTFN